MKQKIIVGAAVIGVAALFATGVLNWQGIWPRVRHWFYRGRGAVSQMTQLDVKALNNPHLAQQCRANLRMLENAKRKVAQEKGMTIGRLTEKDILPELPGRRWPRCPAGGEYILGDIGTMPKCTVGSAGTVRTEDDHIIINY